jgi:hypothetical protein
MNGPLAMYASPIDFNKNGKLENKINEMKRNKLNLEMLTKFKEQEENEKRVNDIHNKVNQENDSEDTLAEFYDSELNQELQKERAMKEYIKDQPIKMDYMISNNLDMNKIGKVKQTGIQNINDVEVLDKLNYIITMFEEQKTIKTKQKNEEIVLYCFLGVFMIYTLDSFVSIGKYSRAN